MPAAMIQLFWWSWSCTVASAESKADGGNGWWWQLPAAWLRVAMFHKIVAVLSKANIFWPKHAELPVRYASSREGSERSLSISSGVRQVYTTSRIYVLVLAKTEHIILYYTKTCWDYTILVQLSSGLNQRWCSQAHCSTSSAPWGPSCCSSKSSGGTHEDPRFNRVSTEYQVPTSAYKSLQVYTLACTSRFLEDKMQE